MRKDDDGRVPIHWAIAHGHKEVAKLLIGIKDFDPDVKVRFSFTLREFD